MLTSSVTASSPDKLTSNNPLRSVCVHLPRRRQTRRPSMSSRSRSGHTSIVYADESAYGIPIAQGSKTFTSKWPHCSHATPAQDRSYPKTRGPSLQRSHTSQPGMIFCHNDLQVREVMQNARPGQHPHILALTPSIALSSPCISPPIRGSRQPAIQRWHHASAP